MDDGSCVDGGIVAGDRGRTEKDDDVHRRRCAVSEFFLISDDPDITHKSPVEQCHQRLHAWVHVPKLSPTMNVVNRKGTVVLGGGCECHVAPCSGFRKRVQEQGLKNQIKSIVSSTLA